jgi:hypothetical protein
MCGDPKDEVLKVLLINISSNLFRNLEHSSLGTEKISLTSETNLVQHESSRFQTHQTKHKMHRELSCGLKGWTGSYWIRDFHCPSPLHLAPARMLRLDRMLFSFSICL